MATVICNVLDCEHRSKRKSKRWTMQDGTPCYGCTLQVTIIRPLFDMDGEIEQLLSRESMTNCAYYSPTKEGANDE